MTTWEIRQRLAEMVSHFTFEYKGVSCGIDPLKSTQFDVWYGDDFAVFDSLDIVMNAPFFNGKSLSDISKDIIITSL